MNDEGPKGHDGDGARKMMQKTEINGPMSLHDWESRLRVLGEAKEENE